MGLVEHTRYTKSARLARSLRQGLCVYESVESIKFVHLTVQSYRTPWAEAWDSLSRHNPALWRESEMSNRRPLTFAEREANYDGKLR